jgi:superfamily II DNA/RNA helicase
MNYTTPTPIQAQAIPLAMAGKDVLGTAQTGTGKTAAFAIPMITRLLASPRGGALVLSPTRELATQILDVVQQLLGTRSTLQAVLLIGGDSMPKQIAQLRGRPRIIVGTPGRINDHLERGTLMLGDTSFLVLDETDRMLDMGFGIQIDRILKFLPQTRQTLMFSATLPKEILAMSSRYLVKPERVAVGEVNKVAVKIQQDIVHVTDGSKYDELTKQLKARTGSIVIFVKTKRSADRICIRLSKDGFKADTIHGDLHQRKRERVIQGFRDQKFRILVATDVASRGLDIPHIEHVINYDLPQVPEDYIHRIGRTARAGAEGSALCLISPDDSLKWRDIHKLLYPNEPAPPVQRGGGNSSGGKSRFGGGGYKKSGGGNSSHGGGGGGQRSFKPRGRRFGGGSSQAA